MSEGARLTYSIDYSRSYFNRYGSLMALTNWIDGPVYRYLIAAAGLRHADSLIEIGAGRGPVVDRLLAGGPRPRRIVVTEASDRLHSRLTARYAKHADGVEVLRVDHPPPLPFPDATFDRFVACFVLDIMDPLSRAAYIAEAHRLLGDGQRFCSLTVTDGRSPFSRLVMSAGRALARISPWMVLGARYESLLPLLSGREWQVETRQTVVSLGCASELIVARKLPPAEA